MPIPMDSPQLPAMKLPQPLFTEAAMKSGGDELRGEQYKRRELVEAETNEPCILQLRIAHDRMREGFYAVLNALRTQDPTLTPEAHYLATKQQADKWIEQCADKCASARREAEKHLSAIDNDIDTRLEIRDSARANEIRSYFLNLKKNDRTNAALAAIENADKETIGAILGAPPYLAGMTETDRAALWNVYAEKQAGDLLKRKKVIEKGSAINQLALNQALLALDTIFPQKRIEELTSKANIAANARSAIFAV